MHKCEHPTEPIDYTLMDKLGCYEIVSDIR